APFITTGLSSTGGANLSSLRCGDHRGHGLLQSMWRAAGAGSGVIHGGSSSADNLLASVAGIRVNWRHALPSASAAGFAMAVATMLPIFSNFFPLWMLGGGWLAVNLYSRRTSSFLLPANIAAKVGALAGLLGF